VSMQAEFAVLDGKTRSVLDLTQIKSAMIPAQVLAQMKSAGLDKIISITQQEKGPVLIIYPNARCYAEFTPAVSDSKKEPKLTKTDLGKETVGSQSCTKQKVAITDEDGEAHDILVWNDGKGFPVQLQTSVDGTTVTMKFKNLDPKKPDASLFKAPGGYEKFDSPQSLMMKRMTEAVKDQP
jgi:hypothetical protein